MMMFFIVKKTSRDTSGLEVMRKKLFTERFICVYACVCVYVCVCILENRDAEVLRQ